METFLSGTSHLEKQSGRALDSQTVYTLKSQAVPLAWKPQQDDCSSDLCSSALVQDEPMDSTVAILVSIAGQEDYDLILFFKKIKTKEEILS